jgi:hypothetical protein
MAAMPDRKTYEFTLILASQPEVTDEIADAVYGAGCDDATLGSRCGVLYLAFAREADSLWGAISSAITDVKRANVGLSVGRVEPDDLVTTGEIAERLGCSRETVRLYALGRRGRGGFPPPLGSVTQRSPLYRWSDVASWARVHLPSAALQSGRTSDEDIERSRVIGAVNAAIELRRYMSKMRDIKDCLKMVAPV